MENEKKNYEIDAFGNYVEVDKKQITGGSNKPNGQNTNIFIYAIVLLLIIIGVLGIILLNNNSSSAKDDKNSNDEKVTEQTGQVKEEQAKDVVEAYCKAFKNLDVEAIMELLPDEVIKTAKEQDVDLKESLENSFDEVRDGYIEINSITIMDNEKN